MSSDQMMMNNTNLKIEETIRQDNGFDISMSILHDLEKEIIR